MGFCHKLLHLELFLVIYEYSHQYDLRTDINVSYEIVQFLVKELRFSTNDSLSMIDSLSLHLFGYDKLEE